MQIAEHTVVSIDYTLTDDQEQVLDSSEGREPLKYLHGAGNIIPGLEQALAGRQTGDELRVDVPPEAAYGLRDPELVQTVARDMFEGVDSVEPGMQFRAQTPSGSQVITVTGVEGDDVTIDANHPLAGKTLHFDVQVRDVRQATDDERSHGHVH